MGAVGIIGSCDVHLIAVPIVGFAASTEQPAKRTKPVLRPILTNEDRRHAQTLPKGNRKPTLIESVGPKQTTGREADALPIQRRPKVLPLGGHTPCVRPAELKMSRRHLPHKVLGKVQ
jgi:hypothetical protein